MLARILRGALALLDRHPIAQMFKRPHDEYYHPPGAGTDVERLTTQLAGCLLAAEGGTSAPVVAHRGMYGWSLAYQSTLDLRRKYDALLDANPVAAFAAELDSKIARMSDICREHARQEVRCTHCPGWWTSQLQGLCAAREALRSMQETVDGQ